MDPESPAETSSIPLSHRLPAEWLLMAVWLLGVTFWTFAGVLSLPYSGDDIDLLHFLADSHVNGTLFSARYLFSPHNEHTVPFLRAMVWASTEMVGFDAWPVRLCLLLGHAAGALACARLALFLTGSRGSSWFAGTIYAGAAGYISSVVWCLSCGVFLLGGTFFAWSLVFLVTATHRKRGVVLSVIFLILTAAALNGAAVAVASSVACLWLIDTRWPASRPRLTLLFAATAALLMVAARLNPFAVWWPPMKAGPSVLWNGVWLAYSAPARFLLSWAPPLSDDFRTVLWGGAAVWILLLAMLGSLESRQRRLVLAILLGPIALGVLIGLGRADFTLPVFFYTGRYYYFYLLPLALGAACVLARLPRLGSWLGAALLVAGLWGSRLRHEREVPWRAMRLNGEDQQHGLALARRIRRVASRGPLTLADGPIPFGNVHKESLALSMLVYTAFPRGIAGVTFSHGPIARDEQRAQNRILDRWEDVPRVCVVDGVLRRRSESWIDFRQGSHGTNLLEGFWGWEQAYRWIGPRARLRLVAPQGAQELVLIARAPVVDLKRPLPVKVVVDGAPAGVAVIDQAGDREFRFPVRTAAGRSIVVGLEPEWTWHVADLNLAGHDPRALSIAVVAVGFAGSEPAGPCSADSMEGGASPL
jgi:hypothetical protein